MSNMDEVKGRRTASRGWLTRSLKFLEEVLNEESSDKVDLEDAISEVNKRLSAVELVQAELEVLIREPAVLHIEIQEAGELYDAARKALRKGNRMWAKLTEDETSSISSSDSHRKQAVKLPKIELPTFNGDVTKFKEFWDQFEATIENSDLPVVTKFTYLKGLLSDEAKATIDGLALTESHYKVACDILRERFGRKELIVFSHIQSLLNLEPDKNMKTSLSRLKSIMDQVNVHVRSLEAMGIDGSTYGITLTPVILSRLPNDVRMEWAREGSGREGDLEWLLTFLKGEIERRERADTFRVSKPAEGKSEERNYRKPRQTAAALYTQDGGAAQNCSFCEKTNHTSSQCWSLKKMSIEDRKSRIMTSGLCFKCLEAGHISKRCNAKCSKCGGKHNKWLCYPKKESSKEEKKPDSEQAPQASSNEADANVTCISQSIKQSVLLQIIKVKVQGPQTQREVHILFDSGSDKTYITSELAKNLKLKPVAHINHRYAVFGGGKSAEIRRSLVKVDLLGKDKRYEVQAMEVPTICAPLHRPRIPAENLRRCGVEFSELEGHIKIDMLIGLDNYWKLMSNKVIRVDNENLVAQESVFGYILSGQIKGGNQGNVSTQLLVLNDLSESEIRRFWEVEHIGIQTNESKEEDLIMPKFRETTEYINGRYAVELPWIEDKKGELLNNERSATDRVYRLNQKLAVTPELQEGYNKVFKEWEEMGIVEEVPRNEARESEGLIYYLPHRPVVREGHSSTKIRPVFDASAKAGNGISLNDCLRTGPNLLPDLVAVLIRFRRHKIALNADVQKAFLQIVLKVEERDVHRFLWLDGGRIRKMRFCRVAFGVNCSPFLLNATIKHHLAQQPVSKVVDELNENLYMDDWLSGAEEKEEASVMYKEANMNKES